ncbi:MFS transporter [Myxococcus sp. K15C18031901]|uniref:MFS transporter n=1 Tax=Myxococcus dinghuensis TaxID=2906761 RepID=UPI0020A7B504|nr:MFS transporter [Myxococcus dinghuensis]MCP3097531.1 MFS transporter [Myxococcus dinghuensis]
MRSEASVAVTPPAPAAPPVGAWEPLRHGTFRAMWLAVLASNVGTWVHDVAAAWFMSEKTGSPLMVAAVQSATTLPTVVFALVAGTLADIVDRRRYLLAVQCWMLVMAVAPAVLALHGSLEPWSLLGLTFALGMGSAMAMPAQAATTADLVPRPLLAPAVALSSIGINIARALGPALGGVLVARFGVGSAFSLDAVSYLGVLVVLWRWRSTRATTTLPAEPFGVALRAGLRYASQASDLRSVLVKAACFYTFANALNSQLAIVVRQELGQGAGTYGVLLTCVGAGAVSGAMVLPRLRARLGIDALVFAASLVYAAVMLTAAHVRDVGVLGGALFVSGVAWITVLSSLQTAAHVSVPTWVRARALSLYIVVFSAGMAGGSLLWGSVAQRFGTPLALSVAAATVVVGALVSLRFRVGAALSRDTTPSGHWPTPAVSDDVERDRGPVLVTVDYTIAPEGRAEFLELVARLGRTRRRDGAVQWGVVEDTARPGGFLEYFVVGSWLEHLRQHERVTHEEKALQERLTALHQAAQPPSVRHFVGATPTLPRPLTPENDS